MRISIIAGCNRRNSSSTRMARFVGESLKADGHAVDVWDLYSDPLPYYDPDEETVTEAVLDFSTCRSSYVICMGSTFRNGYPSGDTSGASMRWGNHCMLPFGPEWNVY